jgi:hypothetical protein
MVWYQIVVSKVLQGIDELARGEPVTWVVIAAVSGDGEVQGRGAENRQLTMVLCYLVDATVLSDTPDAESYRDLINAFQASATEAIKLNGGYVAR